MIDIVIHRGNKNNKNSFKYFLLDAGQEGRKVNKILTIII